MKRYAYLAFIALGVIWGTNFVFMKWALSAISPAQVVLLRVLCGFVPILLLALFKRSLSWSQLRHLHHFAVMAVLATGLYYYCFAVGTGHLDSGVAGMLSGTIPLFSFLMAALFLRGEPINRWTLGGLLLGFAGVLAIARPWSSESSVSITGVMYMVVGSLSLGGSFVYARRFLAPLGLSALALSTWQMGLAAIALALLTDVQGIGVLATDTRALTGLVLGLGLIGTGVAYVLYYFIVQQLGALRAAGVTYLPPLVALGIGWAVQGEALGLGHLLAAVLILAGVFVLQRGTAQ